MVFSLLFLSFNCNRTIPLSMLAGYSPGSRSRGDCKPFTIPTGHAGQDEGDVLTEVAGQLEGSIRTIKAIETASETEKV